MRKILTKRNYMFCLFGLILIGLFACQESNTITSPDNNSITNEDPEIVKIDLENMVLLAKRSSIENSKSFESEDEFRTFLDIEWNKFKKNKALRKRYSHAGNGYSAFLDKFDIYLLNEYGKFSINGKTIFSASILLEIAKKKAAQSIIHDDSITSANNQENNMLAKRAGTVGDPWSYLYRYINTGIRSNRHWYNWYPYKCIGESWTDAGTWNYTAGGLTQFQKRIKHWYGRTWDDFNANWVAVSVFYYNSSGNFVGSDYHDYDMDTNDDYVSERRYSSANRGVLTYHTAGHGSYSWNFSTAAGTGTWQ